MSDLDLLYGKCRRNDRGERCLCLKAEEGWAVDLCADWISISEVAGRPITDYNDLLAVMREICRSSMKLNKPCSTCMSKPIAKPD